jgi:glutathione S-transferase
VRGALDLEQSFSVAPDEIRGLLADIKPDRTAPDVVDLLQDAASADLNGKAMSEGTKTLFARLRQYLVAAANTLADARAAFAARRAGGASGHGAGAQRRRARRRPWRASNSAWRCPTPSC